MRDLFRAIFPMNDQLFPRQGGRPREATNLGTAASSGTSIGKREMDQLRAMLLAAPASTIKPTKTCPRVLAVLMDWHLGEQRAYVMSDATGFANFCTPGTYQILGGAHHESGRAAAMRFVEGAQTHYDQAKPTEDYPYPGRGTVRFYFLGVKGVRTIDAEAEGLANGTGSCSDLWRRSQRVLEELRRVAEGPSGTRV